VVVNEKSVAEARDERGGLAPEDEPGAGDAGRIDPERAAVARVVEVLVGDHQRRALAIDTHRNHFMVVWTVQRLVFTLSIERFRAGFDSRRLH
jgi:hypothetical protein